MSCPPEFPIRLAPNNVKLHESRRLVLHNPRRNAVAVFGPASQPVKQTNFIFHSRLRELDTMLCQLDESATTQTPRAPQRGSLQNGPVSCWRNPFGFLNHWSQSSFRKTRSWFVSSCGRSSDQPVAKAEIAEGQAEAADEDEPGKRAKRFKTLLSLSCRF